MGIDLTRCGDLFAQVATDGASFGPEEQFLGEHAERDGVVALGGAGRPDGFLSLESVDHGGRVAAVRPRLDLVEGEWDVDRTQPRPVVQEHPNGNVLLSGPRESRPVPRHGGVEVDAALVGEVHECDRGHPLGGAEHQLHGVALPGRRRVAIRDAAPQLDHGLAVTPDGAQRPHLFAVGEVLAERVGDGAEARFDMAADGGKGTTADHVGLTSG